MDQQIELKLSNDPLIERLLKNCLIDQEIPFTYGDAKTSYTFVNIKVFYDFISTHVKKQEIFEEYMKDFIRKKGDIANDDGNYEISALKTRSGKREVITFSAKSVFEDCYSYMFPFHL